MDELATINEAELIEQAKTDPLAFGRIYDQYYPKIYHYILHRTGDVQITQEIVSDTFFKAMTKLETYTYRGIPFSAWLYRIASNEITNHYRSNLRKFISLDFLRNTKHFEIASDKEIDAEATIQQNQINNQKLFIAVVQKLQTLPLIQQEIITLRFFENKQFNEISQITGKNINTIKSLLFRSIKKLNTALKELEIEFISDDIDLQPNIKSYVIYTEEI